MKVLRYAVFLLMAICAACNLSQSDGAAATPTVAEAPTPTPEVTLSTYTNTAFGYTIQYPPALQLEGNPTSTYVWIDQQIYITVTDVNPEDAKGDGPVIESAQGSMIGPFTARHLTGYIGAVGGNTPQRYESFVIANNNRYYQFTAYELKNTDVKPIDRQMGDVPKEVSALLQQIVTSLRFST